MLITSAVHVARITEESTAQLQAVDEFFALHCRTDSVGVNQHNRVPQ